MVIGVPKEIKTREFRVGLIPAGIAQLTERGHTVLVESGAGLGSGISDEDFYQAGAEIVNTAQNLWQRAEMIVKVKEPIAAEFEFMQENQLIFAYLHLAAAPQLGQALLEKKVNSVAYETIETATGELPLLTPMSAIAGRIAVQAGAIHLERSRGGKGILLGGVPGVRRGRVAILGGGIVGANAARMAIGLGAHVTVLDIDRATLSYLEDIYDSRIQTLYSTPDTVAQTVQHADLVIGAVLITGARTPKLITEAMVSQMEQRSVIVDVSIDQGGCVETGRPTTHDKPTFTVHDVLHYGVTNMPAAVPRTSTFALTNATMQYVHVLADNGLEAAAQKSPSIALGINTFRGTVTHPAVAKALGVESHALAL